MEVLLIIWIVGVVISFMIFVIGIKLWQKEDYDNASYEDKKDILFVRHKEILAILMVFVISWIWFIIFPMLLLYHGFSQDRSE